MATDRVFAWGASTFLRGSMLILCPVACTSAPSAGDSPARADIPPLVEPVFYHSHVGALAAAAEAGDAGRARELIAEGADVDAQGRHGVTPLMWAVAKRSRAGVAALLGAGARVDLADDDGELPLTLAAGVPDSAILEALVAAGADVHAVGPADTTPLIIAAASEMPANIAILLRAGASTGSVDARGRTALHHALLKGSFESAKLLLGAGAEPFAGDRNGVTPFDLASQSSSAAIRELFALGR